MTKVYRAIKSKYITSDSIRVGRTVLTTYLNDKGRTQTIDLSSSTYNVNTYYPVVSSVVSVSHGLVYFGCVNILNSNVPSWSTHVRGFTYVEEILFQASGWGSTHGRNISLNSNYGYCDKKPGYFVQLTHSARAVFYLRGGGKYYLRSSIDANWTIYTASTEFSGQTVAPTSSVGGDTYLLSYYPVGSVYISVNTTAPSVLFGGEWTKIEGRFLYGTGNTPKVTGGSKTTDATKLTVNQIPSHHHYMVGKTTDGHINPVLQARTGGSTGGAWWPSDYGWSNNGTDYAWSGNTGGTQGHTHTFMPPFFEVYMWYRTA